MKPSNCKILTAQKMDENGTSNYLNNKINSTFYFQKENEYFWKAIRNVIESIEAEGYTVSITKDGKEFNK